MKEKLYTIPVTDAFSTDCECPLCTMYHTLEEEAITYIMGPSYMEDDVRDKTNRLGFCNHHIALLYQNQNRLGLSLMLHTHMKQVIDEIESLSSKPLPSPSLFSKRKDTSFPVSDYTKKVVHSCFVCDYIERFFSRYLFTTLYLYKTDIEFHNTFLSSKGFCLTHYYTLYEAAATELSGKTYEQFLADLNQVFLTNMKRVEEDLSWFIDKFDYRYAKEPWKNSKDALPRAILKLNDTQV